MEGDTIAIDWRLIPEAADAPWDQLATDLVNLPVDVLVVSANTNVALAAMRTTSRIPIVLAGVSNPVQALISQLSASIGWGCMLWS